MKHFVTALVWIMALVPMIAWTMDAHNKLAQEKELYLREGTIVSIGKPDKYGNQSGMMIYPDSQLRRVFLGDTGFFNKGDHFTPNKYQVYLEYSNIVGQRTFYTIITGMVLALFTIGFYVSTQK